MLFSASSTCGWWAILNNDLPYVPTILDSYLFIWLITNTLFLSILYFINVKKLNYIGGFFVVCCVVVGLSAYRLTVVPMLMKYNADPNLATKIIGKWSAKRSFRMWGQGKTNRHFFFKSNGEFSGNGNPSGSYKVLTHQLTTISQYSGETVYNVISITAAKLVLQPIKGNLNETYVYERTDLIIDEKWLYNQLFYNLNPRWSNMDASWFKQIKNPENYQMASCGFYYFHQNKEYSSVTTQACYREKGSEVIHIDLNNWLPVGMSFGNWWVKNNVIYTKSVRVPFSNSIKSVEPMMKKFVTKANQQQPLAGFISHKVDNVMPDYSVLHAKAKSAFTNNK